MKYSDLCNTQEGCSIFEASMHFRTRLNTIQSNDARNPKEPLNDHMEPLRTLKKSNRP